MPPGRAPGPLERFDFSALKLVGIVWGELGRKALIKAPDGKSYFATLETYMGKYSGKVVAVEYKKGRFINAMRHDQASEQNESNTIVLAEPNGERRIAVVKQIVGLIARRIVFSAREGETLRRGERIGMIKFGSRTELTIPKWLEPQIKVTIGQSVRGAADVIAVLRQPIHTTAPATSSPDLEPLIGRETPA